MTGKMTHYYSDAWCKDDHARSQKWLQTAAKQIRENCETSKIEHSADYVCTIYVNENLGIKYWIHDTFGTISEITELRTY